jgi:hypothetical protein
MSAFHEGGRLGPKLEANPLPTIERFVGTLDPEAKELILHELSELFDAQDIETLDGLEVKKTQVDGHLIEEANRLTNNFLQGYGLEMKDVPAQNIHVVSMEKARQVRHNPSHSAQYFPLARTVIIPDDSPVGAKLSLTMHEMMHFKSYTAIQMDAEDEHPEIYRTGWDVLSRDKEQKHFTALNEALTEAASCAILQKELATNPILNESQQLMQIRGSEILSALHEDDPSLDEGDVIAGKLESGSIRATALGYKTERRGLELLCRKLAEALPEQFKDSEEVLHEFYKAYMTGNILPLTKRIDRSFGKGSAARIAAAKIVYRNGRLKPSENLLEVVESLQKAS